MSSRFARHDLIPGWNQEKLQKATVIVVGVGALGNEICRILSISGIGKMIICDPDVVEESNLSRCTLFKDNDIGTYKVHAAKRSLSITAPHTAIDARVGEFVRVIGLATIRDAALVISCVDSNYARIQLAGRCNLVRTPYLDGGTSSWGGEVRPYFDTRGPCYACVHANKIVDEIPVSCGSGQSALPVGASLVITAIIAAWMSIFAIRFVQGLGYPSKIMRVNGENGNCIWVVQHRNPQCILHHAIEGAVTRLPVSNTVTIRDLMNRLPKNAVPMLWEAQEINYSCSPGFSANMAGRHLTSNYTLDKTSVRTIMTYEMTMLDPGISLEQILIPPGEILAYRTGSRYHYIELR